MPCHCANLDDCVSYGESERAFCINFTLIAERPWLRLYRCNLCQTSWQLDVDDRSDFAIKVAEPEHWSSFDDLPYKRAFLTRFHGGESNEPCRWARCSQPALKEMAICVGHAYPEFAAEHEPH